MASPSVSVIVVSRGRPQELARCLTGIGQLFFDRFELIVVANPAGEQVVSRASGAASIKLVRFDEPNISAARNLGLAQAAGEIVAFIDDDAVPEPSWLDYLTEPFADPEVSAAGGFVIGRNGISFQSTASYVDAQADEELICPWGDSPAVFRGHAGRGIKTEGTNCAFRRKVLQQMGGFDPVFRFYLDETDVNLRLAADGTLAAICPRAQVHHGFAPSAQRMRSRMPKTLFDVGASQVVFLRKHAAGDRIEATLGRLRRTQTARLLRHMVAGNCEPRDVTRVQQSLEDGIADGWARPIALLPPIASAKVDFRPFDRPRIPTGTKVLAGRIWAAGRLRRKAAGLALAGQPVSLYLFGVSVQYHRVVFDQHGVWEQRGGLFGKSIRTDPMVRFWRLAGRLRRETDRSRLLRRLPE
ncbi:MAG: glycosyltransferase [Rhodobacteraceae bacterium]|nr:glycosyltransferase [Paracoccaceae bacterium]